MNTPHDDGDETRPEEFDLLVQREIDGEISPEDEARLQQLLAERPDLARRYREDRALAGAFALDRAERPAAPAGLAERVIRELGPLEEAGAPGGGRLVSFAAFGRPIAAAAVLVLLVGGGFWAGRRTTSAEGSSFERDVVEKFRVTVQEADLPREEAEGLLDRFRQERERLAREEREGLRKAAAALEDGLEELVSRQR